MKNVLLLFFLVLCSLHAFTQEQKIAGLVFDKDTKYRLNRVNILNTRTQQAIFNNTKGEFMIDAQVDDILISYLEGYKRDTLKITNQNTIVIYLKRLAIPLPEVTFRDSVLSPKDRYEQTKKEFNNAVRLGNNKDILNIGPSGVGLGIDAIWSAFSKEGKNARKLMEMMERDYQNAVIDKIFNKELVTRVTGLRGDKLLLFMLNFRPSYAFVVKANEYELVNYIKLANMRFKINPEYGDITRLRPIENY